MSAAPKPTRAECFRAAAPFLARLVLHGRRREAEAASSPVQSDGDGSRLSEPPSRVGDAA